MLALPTGICLPQRLGGFLHTRLHIFVWERERLSRVHCTVVAPTIKARCCQPRARTRNRNRNSTLLLCRRRPGRSAARPQLAH